MWAILADTDWEAHSLASPMDRDAIIIINILTYKILTTSTAIYLQPLVSFSLSAQSAILGYELGHGWATMHSGHGLYIAFHVTVSMEWNRRPIFLGSLVSFPSRNASEITTSRWPSQIWIRNFISSDVWLIVSLSDFARVNNFRYNINNDIDSSVL